MAATTRQVQAAQDLVGCRPLVFPLRAGQPRLCLVHAYRPVLRRPRALPSRAGAAPWVP